MLDKEITRIIINSINNISDKAQQELEEHVKLLPPEEQTRMRKFMAENPLPKLPRLKD
jgi:hypothetical protein